MVLIDEGESANLTPTTISNNGERGAAGGQGGGGEDDTPLHHDRGSAAQQFKAAYAARTELLKMAPDGEYDSSLSSPVFSRKGGVGSSLPNPESRKDRGLNRCCGCIRFLTPGRCAALAIGFMLLAGGLIVLGVLGVLGPEQRGQREGDVLDASSDDKPYSYDTTVSEGLQIHPESLPAHGGGGGDNAQEDDDDHVERIELIARRVVESGISTLKSIRSPPPSSELDADGNVADVTPQRRALQWIAFGDPAHLRPDDEFLLQRYALAAFWFATHPELEEKLAHTDDKKARHTNGGAGHSSGAHAYGGRDHAPHRWKDREGWMSGRGLCSWHGVQCRSRPSADGQRGDKQAQAKKAKEVAVYDDDDMVTHLILKENDVAGSLPMELFSALTDLEELDLSGNSIKGRLIPGAFKDLTHLRDLVLGKNELSGPLPHSVSKLSSLRSLDLSENSLSGTIPGAALSQLAGTLEVLALHGNDLTGSVPASLASLTSLTTLYLDSNKLRGPIPTNLGLLSSSLTDLRMRDNALGGSVPPELGGLTKLEVLYLDENDLSGPLPSSFSALTRLEALSLHTNALTGYLPSSWSGLGALKMLYLDSNELSGPVPPQWGGGMKELRELYLSHNSVYGPIPIELARMKQLEQLHLAHNKLIGPVPPLLGELSSLVELTLEGNALSGSMPQEVCALRTPPQGDGALEALTVRCGTRHERGVGCSCCTAC